MSKTNPWTVADEIAAIDCILAALPRRSLPLTGLGFRRDGSTVAGVEAYLNDFRMSLMASKQDLKDRLDTPGD